MEAELDDYDRNSKWNSIFQKIRVESMNHRYSNKESRKTENKALNRYKDVTPYDHSRIVLNRCDNQYINASLVKVESAQREYILTQGPLAHTTSHFWLMVWEQKSKAILMLNRLVERGQIKCHQYWPNGKNSDDCDELTFTDVKLKVQFLSEKKLQNYVFRKLLIIDTENEESREILHYHYTSWPDFGLPESPASFLDYLLAVRQSGSFDTICGPPVIHCSAGIGRSGTLCLVDSCLIMIEKFGSTDAVNVIDLLLDMRRYRMGLIQTAEQLRFSYLAIIEGSKMLSLSNGNDNNVPFSANNDTNNTNLNKEKHSPKIQRLMGINEDDDNDDISETNGDIIDDNIDVNISNNDRNVNIIDNDSVLDNDVELCPTLPPLPPRSRRSHSTTSQSSSTSPEPELNLAKCDNSSSVPTPHMISFDNKATKELMNNCDISSRHSGGHELNNEQELRQRAREEKRKRTNETIQRIKKKQKEMEDRSRLNNHLYKFGCISLCLVVIVGAGIMIYNSFISGDISVNPTETSSSSSSSVTPKTDL